MIEWEIKKYIKDHKKELREMGYDPEKLEIKRDGVLRDAIIINLGVINPAESLLYAVEMSDEIMESLW
jgi:hypothetical protein